MSPILIFQPHFSLFFWLAPQGFLTTTALFANNTVYYLYSKDDALIQSKVSLTLLLILIFGAKIQEALIWN